MGNNNVMGLGGGVLAAIIVMTILFCTANQSFAAGNGTDITNFHIDPDVLFFHGDPELESAAAAAGKGVVNLKPLIRPPTFDCDRVVYQPCVPNPQNSKKGEHCAPGPGGTYAPNRGC
ncbi:hypothetical protein AB3S75_013458 [Citrus x aurantiifolia]